MIATTSTYTSRTLASEMDRRRKAYPPWERPLSWRVIALISVVAALVMLAYVVEQVWV